MQTVSEARPKFSPEIARKAAIEIVDRLIKSHEIEPDQREGSINDIVKHGRQYMDGYELAKTLDDRCYWDCNLNMADTLDGFSVAASRALDMAEKEWAERTRQQPGLPVGARVVLADGEAGEITDIYAHGAAKYLVKIDGDPHAETRKSRRVANFEDVQPETEAAQ